MTRQLIVALGCLLLINNTQASKAMPTVNQSCASWMEHTFKQLHTEHTLDLCEHIRNRPVLLVNTASHCGFTYQFKGLENVYQRYKDKGLVVVGFSSNDFHQAAKTEAEAASICYENYGVSFMMTAPIHVRGNNAHPLFHQLAQRSTSPKWNFNKFLVSADGQRVMHFESTVAPSSKRLMDAIEQQLKP